MNKVLKNFTFITVCAFIILGAIGGMTYNTAMVLYCIGMVIFIDHVMSKNNY